MNTLHYEVIEQCVLQFENDVRNGLAKPMEQYLPTGEPMLRHAVLVELVKVDIELRWKRGDEVSLNEYCRKLPELGKPDSLPPDLVYEAYRVACQHGKAASIADFCKDYEAQQTAVRSLARREAGSTAAVHIAHTKNRYSEGERVEDFQLLALLGQGAFAKVFLARQESLGRQVALKISANQGAEARTMASLEHPHIVQVFSETVDADRNLRLLCMQYVPGATLGRVIDWFNQHPELDCDGSGLLQAVDILNDKPAILTTSELRDREQLSGQDVVGMVCWVGQRLAEALDYAHSQNVLHRDIKPDNILLNPYGRPFLADFNLAFDTSPVGGTQAALFGGTLGYMSPEHLDAFNPNSPVTPAAVDQRSDIYSLGVVLFELACGEQPFQEEIADSASETLNRLAKERRAGVPSCHQPVSGIDSLNRVVGRCLAPEPDERFQKAAELAQALQVCEQFRRIEKRLPRLPWLEGLVERLPLLTVIVLALIPHLLGSAVNIAYNQLFIVDQLQPQQQATFIRLVLLYNALVYPVCLAIIIYKAMPVFRALRAIASQRTYSADQFTHARRTAVTWSKWGLMLSCAGWLPGGILFPALLDWMAGPVAQQIFLHFAVSFTVSGLIAMTYCYMSLELFALRFVYPQLLAEASEPVKRARDELSFVQRRLAGVQLLSGSIPLLAAIMLVSVGSAEVLQWFGFRFLLTTLICAGMLGFGLSLLATGFINKTVRALMQQQ
jgi:serine/threonine protein kinase